VSFLEQVAGELGREEGVPARVAVDRLDRRSRGRLPENRRYEAAGLGGRQRCQPEAPDRQLPVQVRERGRKRMVETDRLAERAQEEHGRGPERAARVPQQVERRCVRPLEVVEHEHQ
jgi:hypothetical protein